MTDQPTTFGPAGWTPDHYRGDGLQPFDVINAFDLDFYEGNALKYLLRWRKKNGIEDLCKARTYVQILIDRAQREADGTPLRPVAAPEPKPLDPLHILGIGADTEEGRRDARRSAMQLLLARLERGAVLTEEKALLRQHVETEIREADEVRRIRYENLRRAEQAEDLLGTAHDTANIAEAERARAVQRAEQAEATLAEANKVMDMQREFIGSLRRIVATAADHREEGVREDCLGCDRNHLAELVQAIEAGDKAYGEAFPATAEGPARPGRLPEQRTSEEG